MTPRQRFALVVAAIGPLILGTGCSAMILASQNSLDRPANAAFPLGVSRQDVETRLGKPSAWRPLPDGGRTDTYKYIIRKVADLSLTSRSLPNRIYEWPNWYLLTLSAISLGGTDIVFVPAVMYDISKNRHTATFTYDPNDQLLEYGPPPSYGSPDDRLGPLSMNEIRERCRTESPGQQHGLECIVKRLAIWGIE